jgi:hypothetical protein
VNLRWHHLPDVAALAARAVEREAVGRHDPVAAEEADLDRAGCPLLGEQPRQHRQPRVLGRPVGHGAVVG